MKFNFSLPTRLVTGDHAVANNSQLLKAFGDHCLIVTSGSAAEKSGALADLTTALTTQQISYTIHNTVQQNPLLTDAHTAGETARKESAQFVVGVGGGSPLDACKAVAVYATNPMADPMEIYQYAWEHPPLPTVCIGTTAGTGSEVTQFAVMTTPSGTKQSLAHPAFFPTLAFGDARYTASLSLPFTISTGLDALAHAVEGYFNTTAGELSDLFAKEAVRLLYPALGQLASLSSGEPVPPALREQLYYASVVAGFTLAQCGTTYCHALGYFLSEEHDIPHGFACAAYLPYYLQRQQGYLPEKSAALEQAAGVDFSTLIALIQQLAPPLDLTLIPSEIQAQVERNNGSPGFKKTAPTGLSLEEASQILSDLFLEKP